MDFALRACHQADDLPSPVTQTLSDTYGNWIAHSTLLNNIAGRQAAITSDVAGTTRDVLEIRVDLKGLPVTFLDTAGLRESDDPVEKIGIERAWKAVEKADIALLLLGDTHLSTKSDEIVKKLPESLPLIVVQNKIDLNSKDAGKEGDIINISAKYNLGIDILKEELKERMGYQNNNEGIFLC